MNKQTLDSHSKTTDISWGRDTLIVENCGFCSVGEILIGSVCSGCFHRAREPLYPHHLLVLLQHKCTSSLTLLFVQTAQQYFQTLGTQMTSFVFL